MLRECENQSICEQPDWDKHHKRVEYGIVRVAHLLQPNRTFQGSKSVCRVPAVGDIGTIVFAYDATSFAVERVNKEGMTVWWPIFWWKSWSS